LEDLCKHPDALSLLSPDLSAQLIGATEWTWALTGILET